MSNEFNILFETNKYNLHDKSKLNLTHLPEGISTINKYEYKLDQFLSDSFKSYLKQKKDAFIDYYKFKYDKRLLSWCENLSTIDLSYNINKYNINLCVNYKQADLLFLLQYEIEELLENMTSSMKK